MAKDWSSYLESFVCSGRFVISMSSKSPYISLYRENVAIPGKSDNLDS